MPLCIENCKGIQSKKTPDFFQLQSKTHTLAIGIAMLYKGVSKDYEIKVGI